MKELKNAPENIWEYDQDGYDTLTKEDVQYSEMIEPERKFVHGLIRYMQPKRVLEIGVAEGGGSIVILNAIEDITGATLTSIDLMEKCWNDMSKDVGFACAESKVNKKNWNLSVGSDPAEVIENLSEGGKFDFAIIDTAHIHPVESLNFLCSLPYLSENCTVILHDIGLYAHKLMNDSDIFKPLSNFPSISLATKLLFDTMVGEKRILPLSEYAPNTPYSNIGVCQLNEDSRKYIGNIFSMLQFPWGLVPKDISVISSHLKKNYSDEFYGSFQLALEFNRGLIVGGGSFVKHINTNPQDYHKEKIVFYGFGNFFKRSLLNTDLFSHHVCEIWDKSEEISTITTLSGKQYEVKRPDLNYTDKESLLIVLTLSPMASHTLIQEIKTELNSLGFPNVMHYLDLNK